MSRWDRWSPESFFNLLMKNTFIWFSFNQINICFVGTLISVQTLRFKKQRDFVNKYFFGFILGLILWTYIFIFQIINVYMGIQSSTVHSLHNKSYGVTAICKKILNVPFFRYLSSFKLKLDAFYSWNLILNHPPHYQVMLSFLLSSAWIKICPRRHIKVISLSSIQIPHAFQWTKHTCLSTKCYVLTLKVILLLYRKMTSPTINLLTMDYMQD